MHVLLTNDDGYDSPGLAAIREALIAIDIAVTVVAPDGNRSARSHAITCREPLALRRHTPADDPNPIFACSGMPADCVRVSVLGNGLWSTPDVVVSGINIGINLGDDLNYSGTFHAAVEAALLGVPAIALSQQPETGGAPFINHSPHEYRNAGAAALLVAGIGRTTVPERGLLNVNLPYARTDDRPVVTRPGRRFYKSRVDAERVDETTWTMLPFATADFPDPLFDDSPETDFGALVRGHISLTPLRASGAQEADVLAWADDLTAAIAGPGLCLP
ncbi:MAG: 5'/3'-nucleotidase SurE [Hyphomicrobiales bacterium]|nr:MAG: 5'/3'-nucleotidase SurE [Hyphomicrobiales bacterium]